MPVDKCIQKLSRAQVVKCLEKMSIQCYDHEETDLLRDALQDCLRCGDYTVDEIEAIASTVKE